MKNLFRFAMAVAVIFSAVSCAKEDISSSIGGGEVEVTFTANLADMGTRAYGEANNVDVVYLGVYDKNGNYLEDLTIDEGYPVDPSNHTASIPVVLLKDKTYDLVFWAQDKDVNCYEMKWGERKMSVSYTGAISQDDTRDAFFLVDNDFVAGEEKNPEFRLYRPFAQLNAGLSADEVTKIRNNGVDVSKIKSEVVVKQVASTLNLSEEATDTAIDVTDFVDASFIIAAKPEEALKVSDVDYEYLSMNYLLVDTKRNVDVEYIFTDADNTTYARNYYNVPLQRNYRTNIVGNLLSSEYDFNVIIVPGFDGDENLDAKTQIFDVATDAELLAALTTKAEDHIEHIVINLNADVTLDVAANDAKLIGASLTKDITINGIPASRAAEPYTLTFNNTNSDWNHVATKGAKLILNNLKITNSGKNNGPWNRHDINFACDVEMNNVVSDKALAFKAGATIKNTTITEDNSSDVYAIWIQPNGQTVTIENCIIDTTDATDGRGIKIDDEYLDNPKKVTLNISGTSFATEEKAAIVVKSAAGAVINASNLDITNVAADSKYAVWVDEDAAEYYNLVEVTGAKVRLEGSVIAKTADELKSALTDAGKEYVNVILANDIDLHISELGTITGGSGEYKLGGANTKEITIDLNGNKLNITTTYWSALGANNDNALFTIKNGTMTSTGNSAGTWNAWDLRFSNCDYVFENVAFEKAVALDNAGKSVKMTDVTITDTHNTDTYGLWITAEGQTVTLENCVIDMLPASDGRGIKIDEQYVDSPVKVTLNVSNTTFKTEEKSAILVKSVAGAEINASNLDITGVVADQTFAVWVDSNAKEHAAKVVVNGANVKVEGTVVNLVEVSSVAALKDALIDAGNAGAGNTIIDLAGGEYTMPSDWTPITVDGYHGADIVTINGNGSVLKDMTSSLFNGGFAGGSGIVIKDLTIEGATIVANNTQGYGAFVNCADSMNEITLINCHLIDSTIITPNDGNNESRMGGLVGWTSGYSNVNDGPVKTYVNIKECSVVGCTLKGFGSIGGICGHAGASDWTYTTIENCTVKNNQLISTDDGSWRVGIAVGTANVGEVVVKNLTESGNTLTQHSLVAPTGVRSYVGRLSLGTTGSFVVDGVAITE